MCVCVEGVCGGRGRGGVTYVAAAPLVSPCVLAVASTRRFLPAPDMFFSSASTGGSSAPARAAADAPAPRTPWVRRDGSCARSTHRFVPAPAMFFASTGGSSAPSASSESMALRGEMSTGLPPDDEHGVGAVRAAVRECASTHLSYTRIRS